MSKDYRKMKKRSWGEDYQEDGNRGVRREQRKGKRKQNKKILRDIMNDKDSFDNYAEDLEEGDW